VLLLAVPSPFPALLWNPLFRTDDNISVGTVTKSQYSIIFRRWQHVNLQNLSWHMNNCRAAYWIRVNLSLPPSRPPLLILWSPAAQRVDMAYHWGWKWWMCSVPLAESWFMSKNRSYFVAKHSNYSTLISCGLVLLKESNLKMMLRISWVVFLK